MEEIAAGEKAQSFARGDCSHPAPEIAINSSPGTFIIVSTKTVCLEIIDLSEFIRTSL